MDPARAQVWQIALGRGDAPLQDLPPLWHFLYFWDAQSPDALGPDGHPAIGDFIPDLGLPRQMWAGGDVTFHHPLQLNVPAVKSSRITRAEQKDGRTGPLGLVTINHVIRQEGRVCVDEIQQLVYRDLDAPAPAPEPCARIAPQEHVADTTLLFRYSALTFNGHRIHYDANYARQVEGYPDLVTHGPFLAQLLAERGQRDLGTLKRFRYRARGPVMVNDPFETCAELCEDHLALHIRRTDGTVAMTAEAYA